MALAETWTDRELIRLDALIAEGERRFVERQPRSAALLERAKGSLAGGVTSSWQIAWPQTIWMSHGAGARIYDVDGDEYVDLHGGYGVGVVGHGHPRLVEALRERVGLGTHFAQPTEDAIAVAEELVRRFGLPLWRFNNSGTEATMDAIHLMRAVTGRDLIVKIEGGYHGHHDSVMVSIANDLEELGPPDRPYNPPYGIGIPRALTNLTVIAPYNDLDAMQRILSEHDGEIAGVIMEPIMMNAGIIPPDDGYLQGVRELTRRHGVLLAFDEVKTGVSVSYGGATELFGVQPDLICLAKAMGGGVPCGAIGGTAEVMGAIVEGIYEQVGTFNGNPLTMAAARVALTEILTPDAYEHLGKLRDRMVEGAEDAIGRFSLPAYALGFGAKGAITFSPTRVRNYRDYLAVDERFSHLHWLFQHNGGVFLPPWGKAEQWTLSVQHSHEDADRFMENFEAFAAALRS
ncbi:MAG: aspartate aminotransferase family protein [Actinomycetota bacterium]